MLLTRIPALLLLLLLLLFCIQIHDVSELQQALLFGFLEILRYQLDLLILCLKRQVSLYLVTVDHYALNGLKAVQLRDEHLSHLARYQDDSPHRGVEIAEDLIVGCSSRET